MRGSSTRRRALATVIFLLALVPAASAAHAVGVSRPDAKRAALQALKAGRRTGPQIVFGTLSSLPAGTVVSIGGPQGPSTSGRVTRSPRRVLAVLHAPAWLFYQDLAPFQQYAHPGRVALVDAGTGKVSLTRSVSWPPLVNGALPAFLASQGAYDGARYRVLYRPYVGHAAAKASDADAAAARAAQDDSVRALTPGLAGVVGGLLAGQHACTASFSGTVAGSYYEFANVAQSRAALGYRFAQLGRVAPGFRSAVYSPASSLTAAQFVARLISQQGCKDVLLYLAGAGYAPQNAINIGMGTAGGRLLHQDVTLAQLRTLASSHPGVHFELVIDAAHASGFHALSRLANVLLVATPATPFTYLPETSQNGALVANTFNPLHLLQFTDRLAFGIDQVVDNPLAVAQMQSLAHSGRLPSALAYLAARGLGLGGGIDYPTSSGAGAPPGVQTHGFTVPSGPPAPSVTPTVTANPDSYAATANAVLSVAAATGVLANDTDSADYPLTVDQLNGAGGTPLLHATSAKGAAITMNPDGSFTYDPTGSATLAGLSSGQSALDSFTYRATDGHGGSGIATVTITVTGEAHRAPVLSGAESSTLQYSAGTAAVPVTSSLTITAPDDTNLAGATVSIPSGFVSGEDTLGFVNQNGITGSYDASTGVLTLTGTSSVASYQAALRSITYSDPNGASPTTGTRTISFQVDDGHPSNNLSNTVSRTLLVNPNSPPTAGNVTASTDTQTAIDVNVLSSAGDPDGDTLHVASVDTTGTKGLVSINSDGTIHYDPNGQFASLQQGQTATDTFSYQVSDGYHDSSPATVTVTIDGTNDPPVVSNIEPSTVQYDAGTPAVPVTSLLTVSDPDDTNLAGATVSITSGFASGQDFLQFANQNGITGSYNGTIGVLTLTGSASLADYQAALRSITYADPDGASPTTGSRTITFQASDGHASNNLSNTVSRDIQVNPNSPPTTGNVAASTDKHTAIDINVLSSATDPDGDAVTVASVNTAGIKGSVSVNPDGTIHYDPSGQFNTLRQGQTATDTFTYQVTDGYSNSNSATVTVTINGTNDAPVLSSIETAPLSYRAQDPPVQVTNTLTISDDDDSTLSGATASITSGLSAANDTLSFINTPNITGSYNSSTGVLTLSGSGTLADYQAALRSIAFSSSDSSTSPATRTVSFTVTDSLGLTSAQASREINESQANQPPVAGNVSYDAVGNTPLDVGTSSSGPAVTISDSLLNHASDPDSGDPVTLTGNTQPASGTVSVNPDGTFTYTPADGFTGNDTFTYTVTDTDDPANAKSATGTVTITVGPVVWYVDNTKTAGNGTSTSPFNTLSAANTAAGSDSIVFLYQGSGDYTGGITLHSGEDLFGQPHGLTVDGSSLVPAGGSNPTITNSGGDGIDLAEAADVEGVNVSGTSGNGIAASGVNDATIGGTPVSISGAAGDGIHISGGSGTLDFTDTSVSGSTGHSVFLTGRTGGTATFGGSITDNGTGLSLTSNTGSTTNFTGTITAATGTNPAFTATGGGAATATGTGSTLATTTGTALDVENTSIGAAGLGFQSISAGTSSSGPARAITLVNTGTAGGLTVTGTGTTGGSGGTIQHTTSSGSSETFGDGNGGVYLDGTADVSLANMDIDAAGNGSGVYGTGLTNLSLTGDSIAGNGTNNTNDDDGVRVDGLTGTGTISSTTVSGSAEADGRIVSGTSGTLTMTVTGSTFSDAAKGDGLLIEPNGAAVTTTATGNTFTGNFSDGLGEVTSPTGTGAVTFVASNNTVTNNTGAGIDLGSGGGIAPSGAFTISNNTVTGQQGSGINVFNGGNGTWTGHVTGNTVGNSAVADSGSKAGWGLIVKQEGSGTLTADVSGNTIRQIESFNGIEGDADSGPGTLNLTMTGNNIDTQQLTSEDGIFVNSGALSGDNGTVCLSATGNTSKSEGTSANPPNGNGIFDATGFAVQQGFSTTFKIVGPTDTSDTGVQSYLAANNTLSGPGGPSFAGGTFTSTASCPTAPPGP